MTRAIIHMDMDAYYASVEERDRPELRGRPVIVGGPPDSRGVVAAANYAARRYGVHSAMPSSRACRLCPEAVFLPPRHGYYAEVAALIRAILYRYTPLVEPLALDEAFLDVTGSERLFGPATLIGRRIKEEVRAEVGLVASVGVAPNKFLAKVASDVGKPDGFVEVTTDRVQAFLDPLPVGRLWGVGPVTAGTLGRLGIRTIGQLRHYSPRLLQQHLGTAGEHLWRLARGEDNRPVVPEREAKSISHETTFPVDITDTGVLRAWLLDLTEQVGHRLRREGLCGRTVHLKLRFGDFSTVTRSRTLATPTDITSELWGVALSLFQQCLGPGAGGSGGAACRGVRLLGIGVSGLIGEVEQDPLFNDPGRERRRRMDEVADRIQARFGRGAAQRGGVHKRK